MILEHEMYGDGAEKVVIMHDWQGDHRNYDLARPFFDTDRFSYAFTDLRGYGRSRDIDGAHTAAEASADVLALADHLGWKRFHVVGHSMTGMIAQRIAIDGGERVQSVVAATPVPACGLQMPAADLAFFEATMTDDGAFLQLLAAITNRGLGDGWGRYKLERSRSSASVATRGDYLRMFNETDFSAEAHGVTTPMLVLLGEFDHESLSEANMRATFGAYYPNVQFRICLGAGHYPMQEMPPYYAAAIESFMQRST